MATTGRKSETFVAPLATDAHTWEVKGLTPAHFTAAKFGDKIWSPDFEP